MYAIKLPSYTKMYKLNGHLFQIYNVTEVGMYPDGVHTRSIKVDSYIDYEKKQKVIEKNETFSGNIFKNPSPKKITTDVWNGSSTVVYFDSLDDAVVYKALANQQAKVTVFEKLDKMKEAVTKQVKRINITNADIIEQYPEFFL